MTEVDVFISTKAVKVLNADTQVRNSSTRAIWNKSLIAASSPHIGDHDGQRLAYHLLYC